MKVEFIDKMGDDLRVANAARVSFDKESELFWSDTVGDWALKDSDERLINYLATNGHWTPFSHVMVTMRETLPIFLARQRLKHMVGFTYNEVSRRYVDDDPTFYMPKVWRKRAENKKQGSSDEPADLSPLSQEAYGECCAKCLKMYNSLLEDGVAPEQARMVLPQSMYTSYYVTGSLAAWARAYKQRTDDHAQSEWDEITPQWNEILREHFPVSWKALTQ